VVLSFRDLFFVVAPQMLGQVVFSCEAAVTGAGTPGEGAAEEYLFVVLCFDVSADVCFAGE
jgi:hypothetical protein